MVLGAAGEVRFVRPDGRPLEEAPPLPEVTGPPLAPVVARLERYNGRPSGAADGHAGLAGGAARRRLGGQRAVASAPTGCARRRPGGVTRDACEPGVSFTCGASGVRHEPVKSVSTMTAACFSGVRSTTRATSSTVRASLVYLVIEVSPEQRPASRVLRGK